MGERACRCPGDEGWAGWDTVGGNGAVGKMGLLVERCRGNTVSRTRNICALARVVAGYRYAHVAERYMARRVMAVP